MPLPRGGAAHTAEPVARVRQLIAPGPPASSVPGARPGAGCRQAPVSDRSPPHSVWNEPSRSTRR